MNRSFPNWMLMGIASLLFFAACGDSGEKPPQEPQEPASTFMERERFFSSEENRDVFYLGFHGNQASLLGNQIHLFVVNPKGDTLFRDQWAATEMLDATAANLKNDSLKANYILEKMKNIIDDKSLPPAVVIKSPGSDSTDNDKVRKQAEMVFTYKVGAKVKVLSWLDGKPNLLEL